jgi:ABC-type nitrate/sulfonate/bicarbonate transport system substrate-binding protein
VLALVSLVGPGIYFGRQNASPIRHRARIALPGFQSSALVILAQELGLFGSEGVDVDLEYKLTGKDCVDLVLQGKADLAVSFETPLTHSVLAGNSFSILTELHRSEQNTAVVARKDRALNSASDFIGKKIAAVPKTNAEFLLDLYLRSHLIHSAAVHILHMPVTEAVEAVTKGWVDGAALWQPYVSQALAANPEAFVLHRSSFYSEFSMLAGLRDILDSHQDANYAILRALLRAHNFFLTKTAQAQALVDKVLQEKGFFVSPTAWKTMDIHLGLSATLLTMIVEEATWYRAQREVSGLIKQDMKFVFRGHYLKVLAPDLVTYE